jgi:hypothetical protein
VNVRRVRALAHGTAAILVIAASSLAGCASEPLAERCDAVGVEQGAYVVKCFPQSLEPVTDPASPSYGRVDCVALEVFDEPEACACNGEAYRVPTDAQVELVRSQLAAQGVCESDCCSGPCCAPCCANLCVCEFLQFSGEELSACQDRAGGAPQPSGGWCYLEPSLGFGSPSAVDACPPDRGYWLRFLPEYGARHDWLIACQGKPT